MSVKKDTFVDMAKLKLDKFTLFGFGSGSVSSVALEGNSEAKFNISQVTHNY
jgi:hypothetical protein